MRLWMICFIYCLGSACVARAETFSYACKTRGRSDILKIDEGQNTLSWQGKKFKTKLLGPDDCQRYGVHATRPGQTFDFCTATKGYADFDDGGSHVVCQQIAVPEGYLGHWALVSERSQKCSAEEGPAEVTTDNIQTYHEDYCSIVGVKEITTNSDPRTEIACIAGGEGGPETPQHETWRFRDLLGKHLFIEQTPGGLTFWQRCP